MTDYLVIKKKNTAEEIISFDQAYINEFDFNRQAVGEEDSYPGSEKIGYYDDVTRRMIINVSGMISRDVTNIISIINSL